MHLGEKNIFSQEFLDRKVLHLVVYPFFGANKILWAKGIKELTNYGNNRSYTIYDKSMFLIPLFFIKYDYFNRTKVFIIYV